MKSIIRIASIALVGAVCAGIASCSDKGNQAEVKETAEQIEQAHIAGREAAREFVNRNWHDSLELQSQMLEAGARRAEYDSLPQSRAAYDSAFISTVRTVRPDVASQLERYRQRQ